MRKIVKIFLAIIAIATLFMACSEDENNIVANDDTVLITVDDAAEFVAASMAIATYGAVDNMNYVSEQIMDLIDCNESESDTRTDTETSNNGEITVSYTISESYSRTCSGGEEVITYNFSAEQTTTSERLDTDHLISGAWTINGAELSSEVLSYDGNYTRSGTWTFNLEDDHTDNVTTSFVFTDVKANKSDDVIFEGTATFSLIGSSTIYEPFNYKGDVVFQANNVCIATFSSGEQYEIDLNTGDVTPI
jgi:hypothetical protein